MTDKDSEGSGRMGAAGPSAHSAPPRIEVLQKRADFLRAAQARRQGTPGFLLQARVRGAGDPPGDTVRVGFTCSKKIGNAVARNRARRRLRAVAREVLPGLALPGWDYVLVGRPETTLTRPFADLLADLRAALARVHAPPKAPPKAPR
ncbi:ribonuclease P protein component [Ruixingdingia sedimenti]|uniref:Ribonuclease P protein component n=1 Tax=Ruixingdingia sedimenti TaxID=3073604 RepID=A0ABU1FD08_9RHOB|nr:ribonuclease P protein component [Xinfangfangia sp. LG-4]MDR5654780.1 ribonuclease P protein component [Xinfangfangia sp. LG-4]